MAKKGQKVAKIGKNTSISGYPWYRGEVINTTYSVNGPVYPYIISCVPLKENI